jgi:hypothetical protein
MGRYDFEVVPVEGDELHRLHARAPAVLFRLP